MKKYFFDFNQNQPDESSSESSGPVEKAIQLMRNELRSLYGALSVKELVCNKILTKEIEALERLLSQAEAQHS